MSELILFNANVITMDPSLPRARLVAAGRGKILAVEADNDLDPFKRRGTRVIDCRGKTVLPGFIDAHCHLRACAERFVTLNLERRNHIRSISDILEAIRRRSQELSPGDWIRGRGYHEFDLAEKRHPTRRDLDGASGGHPVKLTHRTGRAHVLNSAALAKAGISRETPDPPGGWIDRDPESGEPTGLLYGMGGDLSRVIPPIEEGVILRGVKQLNRALLGSGVTTVYDASSHNGAEQWRMFEKWIETGSFLPRITMMRGFGSVPWDGRERFSQAVGPFRLRPGGIKILLDETTGRLLPEAGELSEMVFQVHRTGLQAVIHAVEGAAIGAACSAVEEALRRLPKQDHRHRVEHCALCTPPLAKRLASLGITVVTQPSFLYYNGARYLKTVPAREIRHLYPFATLIESGVRVAGSSDGPVAPSEPLAGVHAAAARTTETGEVVTLEERIGPWQALKMYTLTAAEAGFEEKIKGSITPGKLADLVVLDRDPTRLPPDEIKEIRVEMTILDGTVAWGGMD